MKTNHPSRSTKIAALTLVSALLLAGASQMGAAEPAKAIDPAAKVAAPVDKPVKPEDSLFSGKVAGMVHMTATVESINYETRVVTLKGEKGEVRSITASPDVKRLSEIHQGDTIEAVYAESATLIASAGAGNPARDTTVKVDRAPQTEKPGGAMVTKTRVLATVTALDQVAHTITLAGPDRTVTVDVDPSVEKFKQVKVGDSVYVEFAQYLVATVSKSAPAK